jgi:uncharacterized protein (DUF2384 family)
MKTWQKRWQMAGRVTGSTTSTRKLTGSAKKRRRKRIGFLVEAGAGKKRRRAAGQGNATVGLERAPRGSGLLTMFLQPNGILSIDRVADRFGLSKLQLAETIGISKETFYRSARLKAPKTQARAAEMLEIVGRIADWAGGEKQALAWYRAEPLPAFGGRTAESLVKEGRAAAVRDYLDHIATGGFV